ncbi:hypothetical protein [Polaromonas sp.]|uniref:hypothetical protein n=1 Tax=Polaromonas sp. TaxID=1869339 RepID=UPI0032676D7E
MPLIYNRFCGADALAILDTWQLQPSAQRLRYVLNPRYPLQASISGVSPVGALALRAIGDWSNSTKIKPIKAYSSIDPIFS